MEFRKMWKDDRLTVLAVRMKKGDRKAAARLYDELNSKVFGFFFSRTGKRETAEDLSQDIFVRLVEKIESYDEKKGAFVVWFWRMARNMLIDHYRAKSATPFSHFEESEVEAMAVAEMPNIDTRLAYREVQSFLKTMNEEERELFELRYIADVSYRELAIMLGRSEGSLRVAALRIKEKIKREFNHEH
jgi:RNA polymerase sigma-70 factor (ECF subfamily)